MLCWSLEILLLEAAYLRELASRHAAHPVGNVAALLHHTQDNSETGFHNVKQRRITVPVAPLRVELCPRATLVEVRRHDNSLIHTFLSSQKTMKS